MLDRLRPPREKGLPRALLLALLFHLVLLACIALNVHWHSREPRGMAVGLWTPEVPQESPTQAVVKAGRALEHEHAARRGAQAAVTKSDVRDADAVRQQAQIALARIQERADQRRKARALEIQRENAIQQQERKLAAERAAQADAAAAQAKLEASRQRRLARLHREKLAAEAAQQQAAEEKAARKSADLIAKAQAQLRAQERLRRSQEAKRKLELAAQEQERLAAQLRAQAAKQEKALELRKAEQAAARLKAEKLAQELAAQQLSREQTQMRASYLQGLMRQADGADGAQSTGTAATSEGPSAGYAARLAAIIRRNVVYPDISRIDGDPKVLLEVTLDPNSGDIIAVRVERSSGVPSWDDAALRAVERAGRFPADHGSWYTPMVVQAGPRDSG